MLKKKELPVKPALIVLVLCCFTFVVYACGMVDVFSYIPKSQAMLEGVAYLFYILMFIAVIAGICSLVLGVLFLLLWFTFGASLAFSALVIESMEK